VEVCHYKRGRGGIMVRRRTGGRKKDVPSSTLRASSLPLMSLPLENFLPNKFFFFFSLGSD